MDIVSLGFLFVIVLLGGVSAFMADWLGWRIGKKRHSILNMRPKHFARLVVTIAGALIPLATISILAGTSEGVRVWITQGRKAAQELPGVVQQRNLAQKELDVIRRQAEDLRLQNARGVRTLAVQDRTLNAQTTRLKEQRDRIQVQSDRIAKLGPRVLELTRTANLREKEVARLTLANRKVQASLSTATTNLRAGRADLRSLLGELRIIQTQTRKANEDRQTALATYTEIQARNIKLETRNNELDRNVADLTTRVDKLNAELTSLTAARDEALTESEAARSDLAALRVEVEGLQTARAQLQIELNRFKGDFVQTRTQPLTFRAGDEIARIVVPAGASVADARATIEAVLRQSRLEAERRGARPSTASNPPMRSADLIERNIEGRSVSAAEQIERLATGLAGGPSDSVLVARAALNFFGDEAVGLDLAAFPDPLVFRAGEVVAEGRLDSRRGDAAVYAQINEFLGTRVQERAREAKMVPLRAGGEESFGQIEPEQILEVIRVARSAERVYRLQAIAIGDIRAGDRLKIELRLK